MTLSIPRAVNGGKIIIQTLRAFRRTQLSCLDARANAARSEDKRDLRYVQCRRQGGGSWELVGAPWGSLGDALEAQDSQDEAQDGQDEGNNVQDEAQYGQDEAQDAKDESQDDQKDAIDCQDEAQDSKTSKNQLVF